MPQTADGALRAVNRHVPFRYGYFPRAARHWRAGTAGPPPGAPGQCGRVSRQLPQRPAPSPPAGAAGPAPGPVSAQLPRWALIPLRAFIGVTFCFAGLQKLASPGFFRASDPASIQAQLAGAARTSPVHALIAPLAHGAVAIGVIIALAELAVGLGTVLGLWQRLAAAGGIALSFVLFLTVSFHASPYYTGADIVFVFAWTPLLLAGAGPVLSADAVIAARAGARRSSRHTLEPGRRDVMLKAAVTAAAAAAGAVLAGAAAGLGRLGGASSSATAAPLPVQAAPPAAVPSASGVTPPAGGHPPGTAVGAASKVAVGGSAPFTDPATHDPAVVIQPAAGTFVAFDAVCPHAGCTVGYSRSARRLVCPCHGSQFSAATGAVLAGPAPRGLRPITVAEGSDGQLYAQ